MTTNVMPRPADVLTRREPVPAKHLLPPLPYGHAALEPTIDARTMMLHHDKHHASYVEKLNAALEKFPELQGRTATWLLLNLIKVPKEIRTTVRQNAGGHVNHSLLWRAMSPTGGDGPAGALADAIVRDFGGVEQLKTRFAEAGQNGSDPDGSGLRGHSWRAAGCRCSARSVTRNPMLQGHYPILVNDVWEHAYYLKYENRRSGLSGKLVGGGKLGRGRPTLRRSRSCCPRQLGGRRRAGPRGDPVIHGASAPGAGKCYG